MTQHYNIFDSDQRYTRRLRDRDILVRKARAGLAPLNALVAVDLGADDSVIYQLPGTNRFFLAKPVKNATMLEFVGIRKAREAAMEDAKANPIAGHSVLVWWSRNRFNDDEAARGLYLGQIELVDNPAYIAASRYHYSVCAQVRVLAGPKNVGDKIKVELSDLYICPSKQHFEKFVQLTNALRDAERARDEFKASFYQMNEYRKTKSPDDGPLEISGQLMANIARAQKLGRRLTKPKAKPTKEARPKPPARPRKKG